MSPNSNGKKFSIKKFFLYVLLVITLLLIISTCGEKDSSSSSETTKVDKTQKLFIGDIARFSDTEWEVLEASIIGERLESTNIFIEDKMTEGNFVGLSFRVKNISKKEIDFNVFIDRHHPKLYDSEEREFTYIDSMSSYVPQDAHTTNSLTSETKIQPGLSRIFHAIYEIPKDASNLALQIRSVADRSEKELRIYLGF